MNKILIGAFALSLLGASTALAQPPVPPPGSHDMGPDRRDGDRPDMGGDRHGGWDRREWGDHRGWDHHHRHMVCSWRHHHRVCWRARGW